MARALHANASITINASAASVWRALTDPEIIRGFMSGVEATSDWREGAPIRWRGERLGRKFEDHGLIVSFEPEQLLRFTRWSPLSGVPDSPENYHDVTIELEGTDEMTEVRITQANNRDEFSRDEYERSWEAVLERLKEVVEAEIAGCEEGDEPDT